MSPKEYYQLANQALKLQVKEGQGELGFQHNSDDPVNHPPHYTSHPSGIECIQITRHMNFNLGNAIKYIWRAAVGGKTGPAAAIEDLEKAIWYLNDEKDRLNAIKNTL